jgi:DUF1680 family protein
MDQIENQTGRIRNFEHAARHEGAHSGIFFDDSDVYKALEGMAYSLIHHPDPVLERKADEWIDKFAAAQEADGYLNTYYSLTGLQNRWKDMNQHEMYCAGHLIEAAIAYYQATGKRKLLDVAVGMTEHMMSLFGPGKRHWVPGHEEIELALVKLYQVTQEGRYLEFAHWLLEERGQGHGSLGDDRKWNMVYYQDERPVREMTQAQGHAVRCMYLFCGMTDLATLGIDTGYVQALNRLWGDLIDRKMYLTGGIGSSHRNEGFSEPFDLPNYEAYCETCASVGMVLWNARMNRLTADARYVNVLERALYNGALAGISLAGDRFFYVNPLASKGNHHRQAWYGCACCPSQISRFLPSIGNYIYATSGDGLWVNLYIGSTAQLTVGKRAVSVQQETVYPWDGQVKLTLGGIRSPLRKKIHLRIPDWCKSCTVMVNGDPYPSTPLEKGYLGIDRKWKSGDVIRLTFDMPVEVIAADPRVKENVGKRALQRGPLVYCLEETDNAVDFGQAALSPATEYTAAHRADLLNGVVEITAATAGQTLSFVPYYAWDNRHPGEMKVWVDYME